MRRALIIAAMLMAPLALHVSDASASANAINGRCGIHRGSIVVPFKHRYHVRIGPKRSGGSFRCLGQYVKRGSGLLPRGMHIHSSAAFGADGLDLFWHPFDLPNWNWRGIADVSTKGGITAGTCAAFGAAILADTTGACAGFTSGNCAGNCAAAFGRAGSLRAAAGSGAGSDFWAASTFGATCAGAGATCVGAGAACVGAGAACVEAACVWAAWDAA